MNRMYLVLVFSNSRNMIIATKVNLLLAVLCSSQHLQNGLQHIHEVLLEDVYPHTHFELIMYRTKQSLNRPATPSKQRDQHSTYVFIPYYPHVTSKSKTYRHAVSTACTSNKSLRDLPTSTKSHQPVANTSNFIYQQRHYVDPMHQTSRPLYKCISNHERYTKRAYSQYTDLEQ